MSDTNNFFSDIFNMCSNGDKSDQEEINSQDIIKFAKINNNAIIPTKRLEDGCFDIYACFDEDQVVINPNSIKLIPTGICSAFSSKYRIGLRERGSNTKSKLIVVAGQIDSGFRGEWFVALYNTTVNPIIISKNHIDYNQTSCELYVPYSKAICQFAIEEVPQVLIKELSFNEVLSIKSERGEGMLGSSGK